MSDTVDVPLDITQDLLDTCGEACPIARAAQAAMPGAMVTIWPGRLRIDVPGRSLAIDLPWEIRNTLDALSDGYAIAPCVFTLPIPRSIAETPGFLADETLLSPVELEAMPL